MYKIYKRLDQIKFKDKRHTIEDIYNIPGYGVYCKIGFNVYVNTKCIKEYEKNSDPLSPVIYLFEDENYYIVSNENKLKHNKKLKCIRHNIN